MRKLIASLSLVVFALLGGCAATTTTATPGGTVTTTTTAPASGIGAVLGSAEAQRTVFTAKSTYVGLLQVAVAYKNLPACGAGASALCSNPAIVAQIQKADNVAAAALDAAESAVRTAGISSTAQSTAIGTAQSALAALSALVNGLATK